MNKCEARQYSDQKVCDRCGLCWDMNDPDLPECLSVREIELRKINRTLYVPKHQRHPE